VQEDASLMRSIKRDHEVIGTFYQHQLVLLLWQSSEALEDQYEWTARIRALGRAGGTISGRHDWASASPVVDLRLGRARQTAAMLSWSKSSCSAPS